ncbi:centromere protein C isoform X2 [Nannospalax galili]|uniref:centromere protein C isoform X2 n=1 Tax=Nannospalax galili TaxID=1026970 RepID=UPI0004ED373A|nr:centromere protein C isoform X2 [Nannospalax galili]
MAASGLDHLKNDYRRRFCRPSRVPDIHTAQGQNMMDILQDCFEEKSVLNNFVTNSTESLLCLTPKMKDSCIQSTHKEISHSKSVPVSSGRKEASPQGIGEPSETASSSVEANEIDHKTLTTDAVSTHTPDSKEMSSKNPNGHHNEDDDFYLSIGSPAVLLDSKAYESPNAVSSADQMREPYSLRNSVNMRSSRKNISFRPKKRLNFDISTRVEIKNKKSEVENKISERQQEGPSSETSEKRVQIQPQAKKSFSTLFLETVKRKTESSTIIRHSSTVPPLSSSSNDMKLLEDEFIIDESEKSFASELWVTIPRKDRHLKHHAASSSENTAVLLDKSREKPHNVSSKTLISDTQSQKAPPVEKSQPSVEKKKRTGCALTNELENNCRSTEYEMHSENARKTSGSKRTIKQKRRRPSKANVVDEQINKGQGKNENRNMSCIAQDKLQINSDRNTEECEEARNGPVSKKQMPPVGNKEKKSGIQKDKKKSRKKRFSSGSKNKLVPEEVTLTVLRSRRISRCPSDWWVVKPEENTFDRNSSKGNELSVYQNRQKNTKKNRLSKDTGKIPVPSKRRKTTTQSSSRVQKFLDIKDSGESSIHCDEISSRQNEPLENDKEDLTQKKNLDFSGGPSRLTNCVMSGKNNSDMEDKEVQESLGDSRIKRSEMSPDMKIHHKLVLPSNTPNVRRTKRIRLKPLEYWRGERIDYQERPSGGFVIGGIISPGSVSPKRKAKGNLGKVNKKANNKRICHDNHEKKDRLLVNFGIPLGDPLQPTRVKDPETREIIFMDLIRPRDTYQFFVEHGDLRVFKTLDTPFFSTGKLVLGPCEEKGRQHVGQDILVFYVSYGDILCTLHETPYMITTGDSFYVPSGNYYNITNLLNEESILLFTQIKR